MQNCFASNSAFCLLHFVSPYAPHHPRHHPIAPSLPKREHRPKRRAAIDLFAKHGAGAVEARFHDVLAEAEAFGGLDRRQAFHLAQHEDGAIRVRQGGDEKINKDEITSFDYGELTGMSAPGLDLQIMEMMDLPKNIFRTSVNFMGCYAAIHGMKLADAFCKNDPNAKVIVVCTELCTLHFQKETTADNIASGTFIWRWICRNFDYP